MPGDRRWKPGIRSREGGGARRSRLGLTESGVTLLELLVVVALASILLAIVFPAVGSGLGTLELQSAGVRVAAAARYAHDQSVYRQEAYQLEINVEAGTVSVEDLEGGGERSYQFPPTVRVKAVLPAMDAQQNAARRFFFFPDGAAPDFQVILTNSRRQVTVIGDPLTGTAKVVEQ
jgi:general secretion pathway protein H